MKSLQEDIKNQSFSRVYLFCGPEAYLKQQYKNKMRAALLPEDDSMNYSYFEGKKVAPGEVIALAETMPFLRTGELSFSKHGVFLRINVRNWLIT